jgi:hypothetical protein
MSDSIPEKTAPFEAEGQLWPISSRSLRSARFWGMVAGFGALWGALEITLGSFLHALRLPFGGTMLAATAAALLVAQRQVLPTRGLSLATGVVAAICKSVSPGGVIFGPMIGITVQALLVEIALLLAPRNRFSAALAGALAVLWATSQKVITQYVYYGGDLIELFITLMERLAQSIGLSAVGGWQLVGGLVLVICSLGALVSLWGHSVGRSVLAALDDDSTEADS